MKPIIHIALKSGYSFKDVYGDIHKILEYENGNGVIGVADNGNSFAHYYIETKIKEGIKPLYGARLNAVKDAAEKVKPRGQFGAEYIFIAKNETGLKEIYNLIKINYENFYYRGNISFKDINKLSENVFVISAYHNEECYERVDYIALSTKTPKYMREAEKQKVAIIDNNYCNEEDHDTYELLVGPRFSDLSTYPQHIMSDKEYIKYQISKGSGKDIKQAIENTHVIAEACEHIKLPRAPMIKFKTNKSIEYLCKIGAKKKGIDIINDGVYKDRYEMELALVKEKEFDDYFLIVADMVNKAKKKMLVGPSRGSAAGSLVCYLLNITEIDPIKYDLIFERFIDINRSDLPDIDIDFPDTQRQKVIKQLIADYGDDRVKHIANIAKMKPKSAIGEFSKGLKIPISDTEALKNAIIQRSGGDARAAFCMEDTFETTDIGKDFVKRYPSIKLVAGVEDHPSHTSVHAAGIIVCNDPIHHYAGVNCRDNTAMVDRKSSEYLNLLKIDVLGLRTLSILEDCAKQVGMKHTDFYTLPLDDQKAFDIFNNMRLSGIFQFEGHSLMSLTRKMGIRIFEDITAITSLARPGALYSGGASRYIEYRLGNQEPVYVSGKHREITDTTYSIVVYQEQILRICREIGMMSWDDVNQLRRALSKSFGKEYFMRYFEKFKEGARKEGYSDQDIEFLWGEIENGGSYAFNKSHAVAYALISYWSAYMKAHHPLEFTVANLNNSKSNDAALKILRDAVENEGLEYTAIDPDNSLKDWSVHDGKVIGGLMNVKGIAAKSANKIIAARNGGEKLARGTIKKLLSPGTPFDILWPCKHHWGDIYENHQNYGLVCPPDLITDIQGKGVYTFIGQLKFKNVRDLNEYVNLQKRGGQVLHDHTLELAIKLEDDTDSIMAGIGRFQFEQMGRRIAEEGVVNESWYIVHGEIKGENSRYVRVKNISLLTEDKLE